MNKFFDRMGWYGAETVNAYEGKHGGWVYEVEFEDGEEEKWTKEERKEYQQMSNIEIGDIGWPFVPPSSTNLSGCCETTKLRPHI